MTLAKRRCPDSSPRSPASHGLPIQIDSKGLEDASIALDAPVNYELPAVSLRSALDMTLERLDLAWTIDDECLLVTTPDKASNQLITKVYLVQDLVAVPNSANPGATDYQSIMQLITVTIAPTTWDEVGGPGSIQESHTSGAIVASQTREVHEQISLLLVALRRARNAQVTAGDAPRGRQHGPRPARQPAPPRRPNRPAPSSRPRRPGCVLSCMNDREDIR